MSANGLGYVVAVINQASGQPEDLTSDFIHWDRESAEADAAALVDTLTFAAIARHELPGPASGLTPSSRAGDQLAVLEREMAGGE